MEPAAQPEPGVDRRLSGTGAVKPRVSLSGELELKTTLRELVLYVVFLTDLCLLTFGMVSTDMYYLNKVMSHVFLEPSLSKGNGSSFGGIRSRADFWRVEDFPKSPASPS